MEREVIKNKRNRESVTRRQRRNWGDQFSSVWRLNPSSQSMNQTIKSLRFGDSKVGLISRNFPHCFQGLPKIYLFWINVITHHHHHHFPGCHTEEACHNGKITRAASWQSDFISVVWYSALTHYVNFLLTVLTKTAVNTLLSNM